MNTSKVETLDNPLARHSEAIPFGEILPKGIVALDTRSNPAGRPHATAINRVRPSKRILLYAWLSALMAISALALFFQGSSTQFYGLAASTQQSISFEYPVEILHIPVVDGESIEKYQLLVEVRRHDLTSKIGIIQDKIRHIVDLRNNSILKSQAELDHLKAQQSKALAELDTKIARLASQQKLNSQQVKLLLGEDSTDLGLASGQNPVNVELKGLREQRKYASKATQAQIDNIAQRLHSDSHPSDAEISGLNKRKNELERQSRDLYVGAQFAGSIGSVYYKPGEKVAPFNTVLSLQSTSPTFVKGYIHEDVQNDVRIGQKVWIKSLGIAESDSYTAGIVESLGKRMIQYPERLQKNIMIPAWGREAMVRLHSDSPLLLDEKVVVLLEKPDSVISLIQDLITPVVATMWNSTAGGNPGPRFHSSPGKATVDLNDRTTGYTPDLI